MNGKVTIAGIKDSLSASSMFWIFQLVGWGVLGLVIYAIRFLEAPSPGVTIYQKLAFVGFGFLLSIPLYIILRISWNTIRSKLRLAGIIFGSSLTAAGLWMIMCEYIILRHTTGLIIQIFSENPGLMAIYYFQLIIIMLSLSSVFIGSLLWENLQSEKEQTLKTRYLLDQARLKALRYQLNPHFLFNVLNSIHSVIYSEPKKAEKMVEELSDLLRYTLMENDDQTVTLEEEIAIVNSYLAIEKIRFEERLSFDTTINPNAKKIKIPALIILTLVENAVKHGMKSSNGSLRISLNINFSEQEELLINISNTGSLEALKGNGHIINRKSTKIGLENIRNRLNQHYGERSNVVMKEDSGWVHVKMNITDVNTN